MYVAGASRDNVLVGNDFDYLYLADSATGNDLEANAVGAGIVLRYATDNVAHNNTLSAKLSLMHTSGAAVTNNVGSAIVVSSDTASLVLDGLQDALYPFVPPSPPAPPPPPPPPPSPPPPSPPQFKVGPINVLTTRGEIAGFSIAFGVPLAALFTWLCVREYRKAHPTTSVVKQGGEPVVARERMPTPIDV